MPNLGLGIGSDKFNLFNVAGDIIYDNLQLYLDPTIGASYPGTGTSWNDLSTNNITGTLIGSPTFDSGESGGAILFEPAKYANLTTNAALKPTTELTLMGWIKPTLAQFGTRCIIANDHAGFAGLYNGYRLELTIGTNNWIYAGFGLRNGTAETNSYLQTGTGGFGYAVYNINVWYHVAGTWDGSTMKLYVNGVHSPTTDQAFTGPITYNASVETQIARRRVSAADLTGYIGSVMLYDKGLTENQVIKNFNAHKSRYGF